MSQKVKFYSDAAKTNQVYPEIDLGQNVEKGLENYFAMTADEGIYGIYWYDWNTSHSSDCTKYGKNSGLTITPGTDETVESSDYGDAFKTYDCNAFVDDDGIQHITYLKGDDNYGDTEDTIKPYTYNGKTYLQDVFVIKRTYYERWYKDGSKQCYERTFVPKTGFQPVSQSIDRDGNVRAWFLISKYVTGVDSQGRLRSLKGLTPARTVQNPEGAAAASQSQSYNNCYNKYKARGTYYTAGLLEDYKDIITTFWLKYGTRNVQSVLSGCTIYDYQKVAAEAAANTTKVKLLTAQAADFVVGSCVSVGDRGNHTSTDRANGYLNNLVDCAKILSIEEDENDSTYSYINLDCEPFTITNPTSTYISTMFWQSGFSDNVLGRDGAPGHPTNGKYPMVLDGIELMVGGHELVGNVVLGLTDDKGGRKIYYTNDANKMSQVLATIMQNYDVLNYTAAIHIDEKSGTNYTFDKDGLSFKDGGLAGNTYQETTSGKNLFNYKNVADKNGVYVKINDDGSVQISGVPTSNYTVLTSATDITYALEDGETYTFTQLNGSNYVYMQVVERNINTDTIRYLHTSDGTNSVTFTADKTNCIYSAQIQTGTTATWGEGSRTITAFYQLEKSSSFTSFEKFTGRVATPNPKYSQEIIGATYGQYVSITGKNLYDATFSERTYNGITYSGDTQYIYINDSPSGSAKVTFASVSLPAGTYTLNLKLVSGTIASTAGTPGTLFQVYRNNTYYNYALDIRLGAGLDQNSKTFVLPQPDTVQIAIWGRQTETFTNAKIAVQIVQGSSPDYTFVPYVGGKYEINLGKNLFNKDKALDDFYYYDNGQKTTGGRSFINQEYDVVGRYIAVSLTSKTGDAYVRLCEYQKDGTFVKRTLISENGVTRLDDRTHHIILCVDNSQQTYFTNLQVEFNAEITAYAAYKEPIELNKLGQYQDRIYKSEDKWYLEKRIGKDTFSELPSNASLTTVDTNTTKILMANDLTYQAIYGSGNISNLAIWKTMWNNDEVGFYIDSHSRNLIVRFPKTLVGTTTSSINDYLAIHNLIVYYVMETPIITEIVDQELIAQLEAISINTGINAVTTISGIPANTVVGLYSSNWNYITEMQLDLDGGGIVPTRSGDASSSSTSGFADGVFAYDLNYNQRELYIGGRLYGGQAEGLSSFFTRYGLNDAWWYSVSRMSINALGTRSEQ